MVQLDRQASRSLYLQLADVLAGRIADGTYRAGDRIPSVRKLREQFGVSLTTVLGACRVLEDRGLVRARAQSGHYVRTPEPRITARARGVAALGPAHPGRRLPGREAEPGGGQPAGADARGRRPGHRAHAGGRPQPAARPCAAPPPRRLPLLRRPAGLGRPAAVDRPARRRRRLRGGADDIVITSGAKEAVYLSIKAVTRAGDTVAIESPAYYALLEVLGSLGLRALEIPSHPRHGINLDELDRALGSGPVAAVAMVSNFSNPTGSCMSDAAKRRLVGLLDRYDVPLVEDDVYGELVFEGLRPSAVKAFDTGGRVLYCSSYSKTLSPGLRVGWCVPGRYQDRVELLKLVVNQATAVAPQLALAAFLDSGGCDRHIRRVRRMYRDQMASTIEAVERFFPDTTRLTRPDGGHVLWVQLPAGVDAMALYTAADGAGIRIAPGPMFSASGGYGNFIRLNTGFPWSAATERQMRTLGQLISAGA